MISDSFFQKLTFTQKANINLCRFWHLVWYSCLVVNRLLRHLFVLDNLVWNIKDSVSKYLRKCQFLLDTCYCCILPISKAEEYCRNGARGGCITIPTLGINGILALKTPHQLFEQLNMWKLSSFSKIGFWSV